MVSLAHGICRHASLEDPLLGVYWAGRWERERKMKRLAFVQLGLVTGCSNFLVSKGATDDGSTHIAYNSDGQSFYGYMTHLPSILTERGAPPYRQIWEFGTGIYMGEIPEAEHTYNVIGNMNERSVAIGETTFDGLVSLASQPGAVIDYYSLMWLALQRSATAREAILTMDALTRQYGYASTGETFSVSDPHEVWQVDFIGTGAGPFGAVWVAIRVPEGHVGGHANQARIRTWDQRYGRPVRCANGTVMVAESTMWAANTVR